MIKRSTALIIALSCLAASAQEAYSNFNGSIYLGSVNVVIGGVVLMFLLLQLLVFLLSFGFFGEKEGGKFVKENDIHPTKTKGRTICFIELLLS